MMQGASGQRRRDSDPSVKSNGEKSALNSSCGRFFVMCLTLLIFSLCCLGLSEWKTPEKRVQQESVFVLSGTILGILFLYAVIPRMSIDAGMVSTDLWKPYFACYRMAFLFSLPALICIGLGYGEISGFGSRTPSGGDPSGKPSIKDLKADQVGQHFELRDAFVGTNLTKSLVRTLNLHEHGDPKKTSRYQQSQYLLSEEREDYIDQGIPLPTVPPDTRTQFLVAPVFQSWEKCVTRQRISTLCVQNNPIVAWAIAQTDNLCAELGMVACHQAEPILDPVYHCSTPNGAFKASDNREGPYVGLCGRLVKPPDDPVIEQLLDIMRADGWSDDRFPPTPLWISVVHEKCIGSPDECLEQWNIIGLIGIVFSSLTGLCILATIVMDCQMDRHIRRARMYAQIKSLLPHQRPEIMRIQPQSVGRNNQSETVPLQQGSLRSLAASTDNQGMAIQDGTLGSSSGGPHGRHGMV